jgi:hypothetical protein
LRRCSNRSTAPTGTLIITVTLYIIDLAAGDRIPSKGRTGSDGHRVLAAQPLVRSTAARAVAAGLDIASAAFHADLASTRPETQYTRLFRS